MNESHELDESYRDWNPAQYNGLGHNGVKTMSMDDEASDTEPQVSSSSDVRSLETVLSGITGVFSDVTSRLDRVYHELAQRELELQKRDESVREQEETAARTLADARRDADEIAQQAERDKADALAAADAEAARIVERSRSVEQLVTVRLAAIERREQELQEHEQQLAEAAKQQQAERDWLNQYAQTLSGIAADLERAVGDLQPVR